MATIPEYPPILQGTTENKINQLREYLARLATKQEEDSSATSTASGGTEPDAYLKSASVSSNTLTLVNKDDSTVTFTPDGASEYDVTTVGKNLTVQPDSTAAGNIVLDRTGYTPVAVVGFSNTNLYMLTLKLYVINSLVIYSVKNLNTSTAQTNTLMVYVLWKNST